MAVYGHMAVFELEEENSVFRTSALEICGLAGERHNSKKFMVEKRELTGRCCWSY